MGLSKVNYKLVVKVINTIMQLIIRSQSNHVYDTTNGDKVGNVKAWICKMETLPLSEVALYSESKPLEDNDSVESVTVIDVNVGLKGGKVHGSLARAGKVKGQTPKVDKQEKKKRVVGRARRRIQYNRRFVNVIQTFGRKKGPNSNS